MIVLAFDTATDRATAALVRHGDLLGERLSRPARILEEVGSLLEEARLAPEASTGSSSAPAPGAIRASAWAS